MSALAAKTDVLVVGSGGAGLSAAWAAARAGARVTLITKGSPASCNTAKAQGGIQSAIGSDDSPEQHAQDVFRSSHETADQDLVSVLTGEAPEAISWLEGLGVEFSREGEGYRLARCGGASAKRLLQVGDRTGHAIVRALRAALAAEGVEIHGHTALLELDRPNGHIRATVDAEGDRRVIDASAVVLAAGGRCYAEAHRIGVLTTNQPGSTGEVAEIAKRLGAAARDEDSLQHHPNGGAWPPPLKGYSIPETTRSYGALLVNAEGERFVEELAPRDTVAEAIVKECAEGRGLETPDGRPAVLLDTRPIEPEVAEQVLPYMMRRYRAAGVDPLTEPILTYPVLHYQNGGLVIDRDGRTTVEGVYAAGEITGGVHGRNRMMGNSLLDCTVFGRRAGRAAAQISR
ncbi:MAG: FAD-dependent oxidoreductase [Gaiellales bacterium]|jgi:succinate dehydrogenase/fumarate reductase flavoprotein subunit